MGNIIIVGITPGKEGMTIHLNENTSLKTGNVKADNFWVSWDKIGALLFKEYTNESDVAERNKLRDEFHKRVTKTTALEQLKYRLSIIDAKRDGILAKIKELEAQNV